MRWIIAYLAAAGVFLPLDFVWLSLTGAVYRRELGPLLLAQPRLDAAILVYLVYLAGVVRFAVAPAVAARRWSLASLNGAMFGFVAYATYDLTNLATLKGFSPLIVGADLAWGFLVTAIGASTGYWAAKRWR